MDTCRALCGEQPHVQGDRKEANQGEAEARESAVGEGVSQEAVFYVPFGRRLTQGNWKLRKFGGHREQFSISSSLPVTCSEYRAHRWVA